MILEPGWKFLAIHAPIYQHSVGYGRPLEQLPDDPELHYVRCPFLDLSAFEDDEPGIEGMTRQLVDLIGTFILNPGIHPLLRKGLGPFAYTLCSYLLLPQEQVEDYKDYAFYFIEESYSNAEIELGYVESIRMLSTRIIETLIETFGNATVEILMNIALENISFKKNSALAFPLKKSISEYENASVHEYMVESYNRHEVWRKNELGLYLLGLIADDLFVATEKGQKFVNVDKIIAVLSEMCKDSVENPLLLGRLLCTGSGCVQLLVKSNSILKELVEAAVIGLRGRYSESVKYIACKCLVRCVHQMKELPILNTEEILDNLPEFDLDNINILTETVTTTFLYGNPKTLGKYISSILKTYLQLSIDSEGDGNEIKYLISKLLKKEEYTGLIVEAYVPLIAPLITNYPTATEPGLTRVLYRITSSNCLNCCTCLRPSAVRVTRLMLRSFR
eukprot:TRINITY_DN3913_c0_g1_i13.p1 TRINITY_DN3913_c0_g1~~TRINITY_DN3913_c0_g1_i13.p1  ORF type:complete len:448 (+),score=113.87 TRINITY_DN3913_c0_g1_i13:995-2338(+)